MPYSDRNDPGFTGDWWHYLALFTVICMVVVPLVLLLVGDVATKTTCTEYVTPTSVVPVGHGDYTGYYLTTDKLAVEVKGGDEAPQVGKPYCSKWEYK